MVQKPSAVNRATYLRAIASVQGANLWSVQECRTGISACNGGGVRRSGS